MIKQCGDYNISPENGTIFFYSPAFLFVFTCSDGYCQFAGRLAIIQVLIADDVIGRVALATLLCEASAELLSGIPLEQLSSMVMAVPDLPVQGGKHSLWAVAIERPEISGYRRSANYFEEI